MRLRGWQRAAWVSSWIAPVAGCLMIIALALAIAAEPAGSLLAGVRPALHVCVLLFAGITIVTHAILVYRVHKGVGLTLEESEKLAVTLKFGIGYSAWRRAIERSAHGSQSST